MFRIIVGTSRRRTKGPSENDDQTNHQTSNSEHAEKTNLETTAPENDSNDSNLNNDDNDNRSISDDGTTESWIDFVRRATRAANAHAKRAQIESWTTVHFKRKCGVLAA